MFRSQLCTYPSQIIQRGSASCIHAALNGPDETGLYFSIEKLKALAVDDIIFFDEIPDGCKANKRHKAFLAAGLKYVDGVLMNEHATCALHTLHNGMTKTTNEAEIVGHLHAVQSVASIAQRANQIMGALRNVLTAELRIVAGSPPADFDAQSTFILDNFVFREQECTRSESAADGLFAPRRGCTARAGAEGFKRYVNGNKCSERPVHYCDGCCLDSSGTTTRVQQIENFRSALIGVGLVCRSLWVASPSKSRWLSSSKTLSILIAGLLVHGLLANVWQVAFPSWHIERPVNDDEETDWHKMVRSKCWRAKLYLCGEHTAWRGTCISLATQPVDHLMQRLQALDEAGAALLDLQGSRGDGELCVTHC